MSFGLGKLGRLGRLGVASGRGTGGGGISVQKDMYFSGKNAYIYACSKNGVKELHLYGHSEQDGIPAPDTPAEISSVGDSYLQLYVLDINHPDKGGQIIDFGDVKLRSLPSGVCDEIVYRDKQWRYIQRVGYENLNGKAGSKIVISDEIKGVKFNLNKPAVNVSSIYNQTSNRFVPITHTANLTNGEFVVDRGYCIFAFASDYTDTSIDDILSNTELSYHLNEYVETVLDLPQIEFSSETIYLLTNEQTIKPYLQGYYDVDLKVSGKKLEYIREGLMSRWQPINLNNADKPDRVADRVGGSDLITTGFGYIAESGFNPTYAQLDGIDDGLINTQKYEPESIKHVQITLSNISNADGKADAYCVSINNYGGGKRQGISNEGTISTGVGGTSFFLDTEQVDGYPGIYDDTDAVLNIALQNTDDSADLKIITVGVAYRDYAATAAKERFYEAVAYNRTLSGEEIQNNFLVSQVRNGVNIPDSVDPIDIIAERTYASGKKFPVYNTYRDRDNDNIESFQILGYTVQDGTPTPEAPIPLLSVGDEGLKLCISDSETGIALQVVNFGDIKLRSLPDGTCDSIEWDGTNWKHVQKIKYYIYNNDNVVKYGTGNIENTDIYYIYIDDTNNINDWKSILSNVFIRKDSYRDLSAGECSFRTNFIYFGVDNTLYTTADEVKNLLINIGASFVYELAEPIETILEGIPAPQTFDNETWFGTPSALVKPYMEATVKVKKAVEFVKDNLVEWYDFAPGNWQDNKIYNKINSEQYIQAHNFADTPNSGAVDNYTQFDGIDDYFAANGSTESQFNQLYISGIVIPDTILANRWIFIKEGSDPPGLYVRASNYNLIYNGGSVSMDLENPEYIPYSKYTKGIHSYSCRRNDYQKIRLIGNSTAISTAPECKLYFLLSYSIELTIEQIANNLNCFKQFKGVDGDINILLADSNGDLLTDSENYYLTSN